jgi:hypothetical protein
MEINLRHAFRSYRDIEHQHQAIDQLEQWLQENQPQLLEQFYQTWWSVPLTPVKSPEKSQSPSAHQSGSFHIPGAEEKFYLDAPIAPGCSFTWADATANGDRIPQTAEIISNIIALAEQLQIAKNQINQPFHIASWYYQQHIDLARTGQQISHHVAGDSVDFWVDGYASKQLAELLDWWPGGLGTYLYVPYLINLDIGSHRRWQAGYPLGT